MASSRVANDRRRLSTGIAHTDIKDLAAGAAASAASEPSGSSSSEPGVTVKTTQVGNKNTAKEYSDKPVKLLPEGEIKAALTQLHKEGIGVKCKKGKKPECPNQDSFSVLRLESGEKLFCVFDGHGPGGHDVSEFCSEMLPQLFLEYRKKGDPCNVDHIKKCLNDAFVECQKRLTKQTRARPDDSGTTGTVAYRHPGAQRLYVAHVGDSRAVMCQDKKTALDLTEDHKPSLPVEKKRIEAKGGRVEWDGYYNHRVYTAEGRGGLNMSRALGDNYVKPAGVTEVPEIKVHDITDRDKFLMLCSDGVWEFISSQQAVEMVEKHGIENVDKAAEELSKRSFDEWMSDSGNDISDDITVVLSWF